MNKSLAIGAIAVAAAAAGCSSTGGSDDMGPAVSRNYQVGGFERIEVAGPYDVTVTTGSAPSVRANGGEKAIEHLIVEVENGTLRIHPLKRKGFNFGFSRRSGPVQLVVTVPALTAAQIAGSGEISVDKITGDTFDAGVAGSGDLDLGQVRVKKLKMAISGSGAIRTSDGQADVADYEIAGSGDIDAGGLVTKVAGVSIAGSGNVRAHATDTASVDIAGSGNVDVKGGAKCTVSKAGSGDVRCS